MPISIQLYLLGLVHECCCRRRILAKASLSHISEERTRRKRVQGDSHNFSRVLRLPVGSRQGAHFHFKYLSWGAEHATKRSRCLLLYLPYALRVLLLLLLFVHRSFYTTKSVHPLPVLILHGDTSIMWSQIVHEREKQKHVYVLYALYVRPYRY